MSKRTQEQGGAMPEPYWAKADWWEAGDQWVYLLTRQAPSGALISVKGMGRSREQAQADAEGLARMIDAALAAAPDQEGA